MIKAINDLFIEFLAAFDMDADTFFHSSKFGNFELAIMETIDYEALDTPEYKAWLEELCENF